MTERHHNDPLVLLPGLLCDAAVWARQAEALAGVADVTVADLTWDDAIEAMAARALAMAPPYFALAGLSMGGYVAFEVLRQAPQRVTRLALLDTSAAPDSPQRAAQRRGATESARRGCGHLPPVEVPDETSHVLRHWLAAPSG